MLATYYARYSLDRPPARPPVLSFPAFSCLKLSITNVGRSERAAPATNEELEGREAARELEEASYTRTCSYSGIVRYTTRFGDTVPAVASVQTIRHAFVL